MNEDNYAFGFTEAEINDFCDLEKMVDESLITEDDFDWDDFADFDLGKMM